jgi:hypothetical protein
MADALHLISRESRTLKRHLDGIKQTRHGSSDKSHGRKELNRVERGLISDVSVMDGFDDKRGGKYC